MRGVSVGCIESRRNMSHTEGADRRTLFKMLTGMSFGAAALLGSERNSNAADRTATEQANVQLVTDFCAAWSTRDVIKALPFLADDCVYRMTETTPPAYGHDGVIERLKTSIDTSSLVEFRILDIV